MRLVLGPELGQTLRDYGNTEKEHYEYTDLRDGTGCLRGSELPITGGGGAQFRGK